MAESESFILPKNGINNLLFSWIMLSPPCGEALRTYLLIPWSGFLLESFTGPRLFKNLSEYYGNFGICKWQTPALFLVLSNNFYPSRFHTCIHLHSLYMPAHLILLNLMTRIIFCEQYRSLSFSLCVALQSCVTSSFQAHILSSAPYSQNPSACVPPSMTKSKFQPIQKIGNIIVLYILMFIFLYSKLRDKRFWTEWQQAFAEFNLV
jgi:hypothetical protein